MSRAASKMPTSFAEALAALKGRTSKKIANNTWVVAVCGGVAIQLHRTKIITFNNDGSVVLDSGGYRSRTTKDRLNGALVGLGYRIFQKDFDWRITSPNGGKAYVADGMEILNGAAR